MDGLRRPARLAALLWGALLGYGCATAGEDEADGDPSCTIGSEGCECTQGGGCDPPLACLSGFCVDNGPNGGGPASSGAGGSPQSSSNAASTTGAGASGATTSGATSGSTSSSGSGGSSCGVPDPAMANGCTDCDNCDWTVSWSSVTGATHYKVKFLCGVNHFSPDIFDNDAELCFEVGMCDYCSFGTSGIWVQACDATCCSDGALVPEEEAPIGCQSDCCL